MDKSGANKEAIDDIHAGRITSGEVRQVKYFHNMVEQDHRFIQRITKPMLNVKSFRSARHVLAGMERMPMIRQGQCAFPGAEKMSFAQQFDALAGQLRPR